MAKQPAIRSRYIDKETTITLLLLGGVKPQVLKEEYGIEDREISRAKERIEKLRLNGGDIC